MSDSSEGNGKVGKFTFIPRSVVDRGIAESMADFAAGRSYGPFKMHTELIDSLHRESAIVRSKATHIGASK